MTTFCGPVTILLGWTFENFDCGGPATFLTVADLRHFWLRRTFDNSHCCGPATFLTAADLRQLWLLRYCDIFTAAILVRRLSRCQTSCGLNYITYQILGRTNNSKQITTHHYPSVLEWINKFSNKFCYLFQCTILSLHTHILSMKMEDCSEKMLRSQEAEQILSGHFCKLVTVGFLKFIY